METLYSLLLKQLRSFQQTWCQTICLLCLFMNGLNPLFAQKELKGGAILRPCYTSLECLCNATYVYCNNISQMTSVPDNIPTSVTELDMNNNAIRKIKENDFTGLELLRVIYLGNNSISSIHPYAFRNLYWLHSLNLEGNQLSVLDPSGLMFQHLVSLRWLNLQNNNITTLSKYAFLTLAASSNLVSVNLDNNPVQCDCETLALRNWEQSLAVKSVQISLQCENDIEKRSYNEVEISVFGSCNSSQNDVFSNVTECFICKNKSTNYKCKLQGPGECILVAQVCQKTVVWDVTTKFMQIDSKCENYRSCLDQEATNMATCALGVQKNMNVSCNFCCRGPTCLSNTIGGRTNDFTFYLIYEGNMLEYIVTDLRLQIINNITAAISVVIGGTDVTIYELSINMNQYRVVLTLRLTTFNTDTKESVTSVLNEALQNSTADPQGFLHIQGAVSFTLSSYLEGIECNSTTDLCPSQLNCLQQNNITRCLCNDSFFYNFSSKKCLPESELQVKNITVLASTANTVTLAWTTAKHGASVKYSIQTSPERYQDVVDIVSVSGAIVSCLSSATLYNFTVTSTLTRDFYTYSISSSKSGVFTKAVHGNSCNPYDSVYVNGNTCTGTNIQCILSLSSGNRCLCSSSYYYGINNTCREVNELQVKELRAIASLSDTVLMTWKADKHGTNVFYVLMPAHSKDHLVEDYENVVEAAWTGLDPGTQYNFTVYSVLPSDNLYPQKNVTSTITVWTKAVHGNSCNPDDSVYVNGNTCTGTNIQCILSLSSGNRCLCSSSYYYGINNTCREVNELQVTNLAATASLSDTVVLTWIADKHGTNVSYVVMPAPSKGHLVKGSEHFSGAMWTGLDPGTQYNFTVYSILPNDTLYPQKNVTSTITVWTKIIRNGTIFISYVRHNAVYEPFMADNRSIEYLKEEERIVKGVKSAILSVVTPVSIHVDKFIILKYPQYKVLLEIVVTTVDIEATERGINEAIQNNTKIANGFFFIEQLQSLEVSSNQTGLHQCPFSVTSLKKGVIKWNATIYRLNYEPCPYSDPLDNPAPFATRECLKNNYNVAKWGEVNDSLCVSQEEQKIPNFDKLFESNVTADNAKILSSILKTYTDKFENVTVEMINKTMTLLELLTTEEILAQPDVVTNIMECVNNLINVDENTLRQSEMETSAPRRLLSVIDSISNKTPLIEEHFILMTSHLAVAAHKVNSSRTEDIALVADTDSGTRENTSKVNVDFSAENSTLIEARTSIVIPVKALFDSLNSTEKNQVKRISFIVHRTDILFASIVSSEVNRSLLTNTTTNSVVEKFDNSSDQSERKSQFFITKINSHVISASIPGVRVENLSNNITMTFEHLKNNTKNAQCVFWDESVPKGKGDWSDSGCGTVRSLPGRTTCGCNHLTNFALLMDIYGEGSKLSDLDRKILSIISYVGCGISFVALLLTLLIYSVFRPVSHYSMSDHSNPRRSLRRDNPSKILINLCLALLCSNLIFLVGMHDYTFGNIASCKAVAVLLHYFLLASLSWMAVEAFYMYLALVLVFKTYFTNFILKCSLVGWGVPLVIVIITLAVNTTDNYGFLHSGLCWLKNPAFYAAFVGPVCFILLINCLAFLLVVKQLVSMSSNGLHKSDKNSTIQRLRGAIGVVILLGLSWIFAIFAIDQASVVIYYLFAIFNSLQGLFIFIFYCLLKKDAMQILKRNLPCFETLGDSSYSNSRGITSKSIGKKVAEHKSFSSKSNGNTNSTNSTSPDSRKDSCFSTLSSSNTFDGSQDDRLEGSTDTNNTTVMNTTGTPQPPLGNKSIQDDLQVYIPTQSDYLVRNFDNIQQDSPTMDTTRGPTSEEHDSNDSYTMDTDQTSIPDGNYVSDSHKLDTDQISIPEENSINNSHTIDTDQISIPEENSINDSHTIDTDQISIPEENSINDSITIDTDQISISEENSINDSHTIDTDQISIPEENSINDSNTIDTDQISISEENSINNYHTIDTDQVSIPEENYVSDSHTIDTHSKSTPEENHVIDSHTVHAHQNLIPELNSVSDSEQQPGISSDSGCSKESVISSPALHSQASSNIQQTVNESSAQLDFPESSSLGIAQLPSSPANSSTIMALLNPSFIPLTAEGEIDYSHTASVAHSRKKFEWSVSESSEISESSDINATKI